MDFGLKGKIALVTGTASQIGIGKAIALTLAQEGCTVICNDIDLEGAQKTVDEIRALGQESLAIKANVTKHQEVLRMVKQVTSQFGRIDILVNNAGGATATGPFCDQKEEDWDRDIALNLKGVMICTQAVLPQMQQRKYGKIISISSGVAKNGAPNFEAYAACKAGIAGFSKSLALALATSGRKRTRTDRPGLPPNTPYIVVTDSRILYTSYAMVPSPSAKIGARERHS